MGRKPPAAGTAFRFRGIIHVLKAAGLLWATAVFLVVFVVCSLVVSWMDPGIPEADSLWTCFQAMVTIGYGDVVPTTTAGRLAIVVLSLFSVFYLAVITGVVVSWVQESMRARRDESIAAFLDELTHLEEMSRDELAALSDKIRRMRS